MKLHQVVAAPQGPNAALWRPKVIATHTDHERACQHAWDANRDRSDDAPWHHVRTLHGLALVAAIPSLLRSLRASRA
ncbi:hypothetical protein PH213_20435 [Streptomyces sp. SRF1]|uniref:hypothetical protein n=1 Tax=Streptomyces sp. SRF1 TaxID=1549642 RepID=UPI0025AFE220|nr:hypothetical protein [Streptomyces sp. SRF1]MDN3056875.1 hypothetical protein [Streptomyces sp. SRF1]